MNVRAIVTGAALAATATWAAQALAADLYVYLPGGDEPRVEEVAGDDRFQVHLVVGNVVWPPASCPDVCVTFETFEKSARRTGTLLRVATKGGGFRRDREIDFLPQVSSDAVKDHVDSLLIVTRAILHEAPPPDTGALVPRPAERKVLEPPLDDQKERTSKKAAEKREPPRPPPRDVAFPLSAGVGADWLTSRLMAPTAALEAGARFPHAIAAFLGYRYRFDATVNLTTAFVTSSGQRFTAGLGAYLPRYRKLDVAVYFAPAVETLEITSDEGVVRHGNLVLMGAEAKALYRVKPDFGMHLSLGAHYAVNKVAVEYQRNGAGFEAGGFSAGFQAGLFYEIAP